MLTNPRNASRRNGKPASCEPCRINKTRCDHGMPKCDRCKQRGIEERCFYHPAPLTKPRNTSDDAGTGESRPLKRKYEHEIASRPPGLTIADAHQSKRTLNLSTRLRLHRQTTSSQMQLLLTSTIQDSLDQVRTPSSYPKMRIQGSLENVRYRSLRSGPIMS